MDSVLRSLEGRRAGRIGLERLRFWEVRSDSSACLAVSRSIFSTRSCIVESFLFKHLLFSFRVLLRSYISKGQVLISYLRVRW
uniref:Uncharacterized protein n=1 Tax=uncultured marine group II/III euryarchaeote KM3_37_G11 TaxID=1456444 RepID=A0A075H4Y2_9EURY|nr:hypothetical protein [uncultured marine group II/III euryarchaeote KM3_37_G11]